MRRAALGILCCLPWLAVAASASAGVPSSHRQNGPWQILSVGEAGSHRLDYCAAEAEFDGGFVLTVERDQAGHTVLILQTQAPFFVAKAVYDVRIAVGPGFATDAIGHASDAKSLALQLPVRTDLLATLAHSRSLSLSLRGEADRFALADAGPAMADLEHCFANALQDRTSPVASIVERVLDRTVRGPIQQAYPAGSKRNADRDYAWSEGQVAGGAREVDVAPGATFLDLVLSRLDRLVARCNGHFAPELDAPLESAQGVIETGIGTCRGPDADSLVALLYLKAGNQFVEFVLEAPAEARAATIADREHIAKIVRTLILIR